MKIRMSNSAVSIVCILNWFNTNITVTEEYLKADYISPSWQADLMRSLTTRNGCYFDKIIAVPYKQLKPILHI